MFATGEPEMKNLRATAVAAILTGIAVAAHAQQMAQSELQSKGATIVAKDELGTLVKGATLRWTNTNGADTQLKLGDDGSFVGHSQAATRGKGMDLSGTWQITNDGKFCRAQVARGQTDKYCWTVSKLGDKYFYTAGSGPAIELNISK